MSVIHIQRGMWSFRSGDCRCTYLAVMCNNPLVDIRSHTTAAVLYKYWMAASPHTVYGTKKNDIGRDEAESIRFSKSCKLYSGRDAIQHFFGAALK